MSYGTLAIDVLNTSTGVLSTQNGVTGIAKAWVNFNGSGGATINNSFNVSSVTRSGTGLYVINFTTPMSNSNYIMTGTTSNATQSWVTLQSIAATTTTSCGIYTLYAASAVDGNPVMVVFHGT